jgi:hypothetical protein
MPAGAAPLPALLARVLVGFRAGARMPVPVEWWANLLRAVGDGDGGVRRRDLPALSRLSRRALDPMVEAGQRAGLLAVEPGERRGQATVRLTAAGAAASQASAVAVAEAEAAWAAGDRAADVAALRAALAAVVGALDLELPHWPLGYGAVDSTMTGGRVVPADPGPPPVPAHGRDWRPVARTDGPGAAATLPLPALASQALVAFTIDYEAEARLSLASTSVLQVPGLASAAGVPAADLPPQWAWHGHGHVEAGPAKAVRLTPYGRSLRDEYRPLTAGVEARWRVRFGAGAVDGLRRACPAVVAGIDPGPRGHTVVDLIAGWFPGGTVDAWPA